MDGRDDSRAGQGFGVKRENGGEGGAVLNVGGVEVERWVEVGRKLERGVVLRCEDADAVEDFDVRVGLVVEDDDAAVRVGSTLLSCYISAPLTAFPPAKSPTPCAIR